jgi:ribosomal protein L11 methyltransferase
MDYIELRCIPKNGSHIRDLLILKLAEIGFESFSEEEDCILAYIPVQSFSEEVKGLLATSEIKGLLESCSEVLIPDQNWNAVWESAYDPVVVDHKCMIRAPFHNPDPDVEYDILIEPKMSFGTAHHETTRLMIRYLLEIDVSGKMLLDMGSGTGVLAILASLKGARPVTAIDNDEWAYNNAKENVLNNNQREIEVLTGDATLLEGKCYDIILANINRNILLADIPAYRKCLSSGGMLIMSGFYEADLEQIIARSNEYNLVLSSFKTDHAWSAAAFVVP